MTCIFSTDCAEHNWLHPEVVVCKYKMPVITESSGLYRAEFRHPTNDIVYNDSGNDFCSRITSASVERGPGGLNLPAVETPSVTDTFIVLSSSCNRPFDLWRSFCFVTVMFRFVTRSYTLHGIFTCKGVKTTIPSYMQSFHARRILTGDRKWPSVIWSQVTVDPKVKQCLVPIASYPVF